MESGFDVSKMGDYVKAALAVAEEKLKNNSKKIVNIGIAIASVGDVLTGGMIGKFLAILKNDGQVLTVIETKRPD